jgi:hypothetical protein
MRKLWNWVLVVAVVVVGAEPARPADKDEDKETRKQKHQEKLIAQEGAIEVVLLRHKSVQEDLKLSDEVITKVQDFSARQWKKAQEVQNLSEDKREAKWQEMTKENKKFLKGTLTTDQLKRLDQIGMQVAGLLWVNRADVSKQLGLTSEQRKKARQLQKTAHKEMHDLIHSDSKEEKAEKFHALHETNRKRLSGLLTDEQKATWKTLRGKKFQGDLSKD